MFFALPFDIKGFSFTFRVSLVAFYEREVGGSRREEGGKKEEAEGKMKMRLAKGKEG